ncbi:MAG: hypothetical protein EP338_07875 [Bacteroidetes bacterium]|nr:MAG: hypothetical protein EP338_07875 [Bacteroidota bacterium]
MEWERRKLVFELARQFSKDLDRAMEPFSDSEKVEVLEYLIKAVKKLRKEEKYEDIYKKCIDPILVKFREKSRVLFQVALSDYFFPESNKFFELILDKGDSIKDSNLDQHEHSFFIERAENLLHSYRQQLYLRSNVGLEGTPEDNVPNKSLCTIKQWALYFHYLNKVKQLCHDKKPLAEMIHMLTGYNESNIYKILLNPLQTNGYGKQSEVHLKKELKFIRSIFERLQMKEALINIDKDLKSF